MKRILVTGASSGIGSAFAINYAKPGATVLLVGRNENALHEVRLQVEQRGAKAEVHIADLSQPDDIDRICASAGVVNVLIANAGVTHAASIGTTDLNELDRIGYLMSGGVVRMCEQLVPQMIEQGSGIVVIVASIAAFTPMRKAAPYAAAKSHVTAYARSLALEVEPKSVRVLAVCPGYVHTDLHRRAGLDHLNTTVPKWMWLEPDDIVRATQRGLNRQRNVIVPGFVYRLVLPFLSSRIAQNVWRRLTRRR